MKYRCGQKVRINRNCDQAMIKSKILEKLDPPYIATICKTGVDFHTDKDSYLFKEILCWWHEEEIEGLYIEPDELIDRIKSRFEILDL